MRQATAFDVGVGVAVLYVSAFIIYVILAVAVIPGHTGDYYCHPVAHQTYTVCTHVKPKP